MLFVIVIVFIINPINRDETCACVAEVLHVADFEPFLLFPPACLLLWRETADVLVWIWVDTHDCKNLEVQHSDWCENESDIGVVNRLAGKIIYVPDAAVVNWSLVLFDFAERAAREVLVPSVHSTLKAAKQFGIVIGLYNGVVELLASSAIH